ncbi:nucleotidyltransferase [Acrocarpospora corrugata]|nr:nucleotidyltransferase [Acrocarpospora corrugata]
MTDGATARLLDDFITAIRPVVPLVSMWAHGSLAGGDYQPTRSDLDLVAVLSRACTAQEEHHIADVHEILGRSNPLAVKLHCGYLPAAEAADPARAHLAWAHEELLRRPITPVTRRELHEFGLVLYGEPPAVILPPVTERQLTDFVLHDLKTFWRPSLDHPEWWLKDIWVDLGLLTLARATVTLRTGKLISKRDALGVLQELDAPAEVVEDIRRRRYGDPRPAGQPWLAYRAESTLAFLGPAIDRLVAGHKPTGTSAES